MAQDHGAAEQIQDLENDNARLRRLLDQQNAPRELRHRLRSTLALLRAVITGSTNSDQDVDAYAAHLIDRLDAIVRAQATADMHGAVDLHGMVADELLFYHAHEGEQVSLSGPEIAFQPWAGQVMALAIHELAMNAVEHGMLGSDSGRIEVSWALEDEQDTRVLNLLWKEFGGQEAHVAPPTGFGAEVLTKMLAYDLQADTRFDTGPADFTCTIRMPLSQRVAVVGKE